MKRIAAKIKKYLKLWELNLYASLMQRMAFRFNFLLMIIGVFLQMALILIFIKVIFSFINNLSGWTYNQALLVVASYMLVEGLIWATCAYLAGISSNIRLGTLDYLLVKPIETQFLVSIWRGDPEDWSRVVTALIVFFFALGGIKLPASVLFVNIFYYLILIFCAYIIVYSITLIVRTFSFWIIESRAFWGITDTLTKMSQYPTDIFFHKTVRVFFSAVIPLAFVATVPAKVLIYGPRLDLIFFAVLLAVIFFIISRKFWLYGLKHYASASS